LGVRASFKNLPSRGNYNEGNTLEWKICGETASGSNARLLREWDNPASKWFEYDKARAILGTALWRSGPENAQQ
jgi:hypothetical protein